MTTAVPKVYRGSTRPVGWALYTDMAANTPRLLPSNAVAVLTLTRWGTSLTKRSDGSGLSLYVGSENIGPAVVTWTPTLTESRMFNGRVHAELEYWADDIQLPLLPPDAALDFVNGNNSDTGTDSMATTGNWTPVLTFATPGDLAVSYNTAAGEWTRIGNLFICEFRIGTSSFVHTTASGALRITGLPATVSLAYRTALAEWQGIANANYTAIGVAPAAGLTVFTLRASGPGDNIANVSHTDVPSGGTVQLRGIAKFTVA